VLKLPSASTVATLAGWKPVPGSASIDTVLPAGSAARPCSE
jgi:hypothetical protein